MWENAALSQRWAGTEHKNPGKQSVGDSVAYLFSGLMKYLSVGAAVP